jgi:hypothetical protein
MNPLADILQQQLLRTANTTWLKAQKIEDKEKEEEQSEAREGEKEGAMILEGLGN